MEEARQLRQHGRQRVGRHLTHRINQTHPLACPVQWWQDTGRVSSRH